jgi:hypothetical protein
VFVVAGNSTDVTPYLLFSTQQAVYKQYLNDSTSPIEQILTPSTLGLLGLSYHLRLDSIFWVNGQFLQPSIMSARLDGSGERAVVTGDLGDPADLAVDWLNDRLYWVDRSLRLIGEYDLRTHHRSVVLTTGAPGASNPSALALYPYPDYGWIYWTDGNKLQKASVTGDDQSTLRNNLYCVQVLTIDYSSLSIYWIDHCLYVIQSLRLDGDATTHTFPFYTTIVFASGLVIYNNTFFWSEQNGVFERENANEAEVLTVYDAPQGHRATGVQLVHLSVQPHVEDFVDMITPTDGTFTFQCSAECVNGDCIPPGLCACNAGWRGKLCDTDLNECERQNGGCEYECLNTVGSFQCTLPDPEDDVLDDEDNPVPLCEDMEICVAPTSTMTSPVKNFPSTSAQQLDQSLTSQSSTTNNSHSSSEASGSHGPSSGSGSHGPRSGSESYGPSSGSESHGPSSGSGSHGPRSGSESYGPSSGSESHGPSSGSESHGPSSGSERSTQSVTVRGTLQPVDATSLRSVPLPLTSSSDYSTVLSENSFIEVKTASVFTLSSVTSTLLAIPTQTDVSNRALVPSQTITLTTINGSASPDSKYTSDPISIPVHSTGVAAQSSFTKTSYHTSVSLRKDPASSGTSLGSRETTIEMNTSTHRATLSSSTMTYEPTTLTPTTTPNDNREIDVASTRRNGDRDNVIIITTVLIISGCLITASAVILLVVLMTGRKRRRTGSYSPEQFHHTPLTLNLSVKRISNTFSYAFKF